jgi:predicted transcriptional regulator
MSSLRLTHCHERVLAVLPVEEPTSLDELRERTGHQLCELLGALIDLTNHGYIRQETRPNTLGGVDRLYVQLATRNAATEKIEREPDAEEIRPLTTYLKW